jgi:hypothetical protein
MTVTWYGSWTGFGTQVMQQDVSQPPPQRRRWCPHPLLQQDVPQPESPQVAPQLEPQLEPQLDPQLPPQLEPLPLVSAAQEVATGCSQWPRSTQRVRVSETGMHSTICRVACRVSVCGSMTVYCSCCSFHTGTDTV